MNAGSHAQQLMQMAAKDISALRVMISSEAIADEIFGFHAQQAAEKVLKAWIDQAGGTFGWVHDLRILLLTLQDLGFSIERYLELIHLNSYAVRFRYEPSDEEDAPLDRLETLRMVNELYEHVLNNSEEGENL